MFSGDCPDWHENTCMRSNWRTENWGTVTEAMGIQGEGLDLREILSGQASFNTSDTPPVKVLEKMAADGLKFETDFIRESWESGTGRVKNGKFQYGFESDAEKELAGKGTCFLPIGKMLVSEEGIGEWERAYFTQNGHTFEIHSGNGELLETFDEKGQKVKGLEFAHTSPDKDGNVYYKVPESDLKNVGTRLLLTEDAKVKWLKKLNLNEFTMGNATK